jgi:hypothetical protein
MPGPTFGRDITDVEKAKVKILYNEARTCFQNRCYTACVLCCRKLLMSIVVDKGAFEGNPFIQYVEYLSNQGFAPPESEEWLDHIRTKGNEANHEIRNIEEDDAEDLLTFLEMTLTFLYEFPAKYRKIHGENG